MEQTDALLDKGDSELLCGLKDIGVVLAAAWGSNVLGTRSCGSEDVVDEWELIC